MRLALIAVRAMLTGCSSVIAMNLLSTDEILRAGRSSLKSDADQQQQ